MARTFTYTGDTPRTYPTYLDVTDPEQRRTLTAEPGESYAIEPAAGQVLPDEHGELQPADVPVPPDDGLWKTGHAKKKNDDEKDGD